MLESEYELSGVLTLLRREHASSADPMASVVAGDCCREGIKSPVVARRCGVGESGATGLVLLAEKPCRNIVVCVGAKRPVAAHWPRWHSKLARAAFS